MAVIESGRHVLYAVADSIHCDRIDGKPSPTKILMSQRQYDAFMHWRRTANHFEVKIVEPELDDSSIFGLPIVICPDCDLYVV